MVGLVVSENLFRLYPQYSEGDLAKSKAYIVSETALADAAQAMGLEEFVVMSASEAAAGGRRRRSILADAFEAVIAAIYLDRGIVAARRVVRNALLETPARRRHRRTSPRLQIVASGAHAGATCVLPPSIASRTKRDRSTTRPSPRRPSWANT